MKKFISFSGGVESSTMCVLFGNTADAIFADTGFEHQEIYKRLDLVENWCKKFHREDFKIHRIRSKYKSLPERIKSQAFYPSFNVRYCTREFKIQPIDEFLKQYEESKCVLMIGLNYEELDRIEKQNHGNMPFVKYRYPLASNRITRKGCIKILIQAGLNPNFPPYMKRGGCIGCFYKSLKEYEIMSLLNPKEFKIVEDLEIELQTTNKEGYTKKRDKYYSILPVITMTEIRRRANKRSKMSFFKPEQVYVSLGNSTPCGVFCNR